MKISSTPYSTPSPQFQAGSTDSDVRELPYHLKRHRHGSTFFLKLRLAYSTTVVHSVYTGTLTILLLVLVVSFIESLPGIHITKTAKGPLNNPWKERPMHPKHTKVTEVHPGRRYADIFGDLQGKIFESGTRCYFRSEICNDYEI
jgi:hypothetical protein